MKQMILHFKIKPGECIPEEKIAKLIDSSRTPVREALLQLSQEGLVEMHDQRVSKVSYFDEEEIKQIGVIRLSQDLLSNQLAIKHGSNADFDKLRHMANLCKEGAKSGNVYERIVLDSEFHIQISKISKNKILIENQIRLYRIVHLIQIAKYTSIEDSVMQISEHDEIVEAFYNRDLKKTNNMTCKHLQSFYDIDKEIVDRYIL